jgi:hypothetical protein
LNGFFVIAKKDLKNIQDYLEKNDLTKKIYIEEVSVTKEIHDLRSMIDNRWVKYMNTLPADKYEFVID